jgi:serine/threonine protein phosphatase 1
MELLKKINLQSDDTLYILGDAIDRGPESIKCLQHIMGAPNMKMLMGNHEQMMLDALTSEDYGFKQEMLGLWRHYNGGYTTYMQFDALHQGVQRKVVDFIRTLPYYYEVKIGSKKYLLVHAGINCRGREHGERLTATLKRQSQSHPKSMIWLRREFILNRALPSYKLIFGHTPTESIPGHRICMIYFDKLWKDKIGIDCGC